MSADVIAGSTDAATGVTLTLRDRPGAPLDLTGVTADRCAALDTAAIAALPVWLGRDRVTVGDLFVVRGGQRAHLTIAGDLTDVHGVGAGNAAGEVHVEGQVGREAGARMTGGLVHVRGSAGDDAGLAMSGGVLRIDGAAGDRLGANAPGASKGMTGGEIVVLGSAGCGAGALMRRGLIAVAGSLGADPGRGMIAGTIVALGPIEGQPGLGNKRGSLVAGALVDVPATYRLACVYEPPHLRLLFTSLQRRFGFPGAALRDGRFRRYCGDAGLPGKGELLVWAGDGF